MQISDLIVSVGILLLLQVTGNVCSEQAEHRDFQYNSVVDPKTGRYNFAYDTGHDNDIAHSLHMQYQDADGIVRGRYGYTDPRGKLRMVEYEAGPNGFVARGDVGPDQFPHGQAPAPSTDPVISSYTAGNDLQLDPAPIQMAGWNPETDPMGEAQPDITPVPESVEVTLVNSTGGDVLSMYGPQLGFYPRDGLPEDEDALKRQLEAQSLRSNPDVPILENNDLNIYSIDVAPDDIRTRANSPVRRSADGSNPAPIVQHHIDSKISPIVQQPIETKTLPIIQQSIDSKPISLVRSEKIQENRQQSPVVRAVYYPRYTHDHDSGVRYYVPGRYYYRPRQTHDHDAERYSKARQTQDHNSEVRYYRAGRYYYRPRQTHDHDAERYYKPRQTHDHDAELRRYRSRQTHDHDAERDNYYNRVYGYSRNYTPRRIYYRDSHSMEPHEHVSSAYTNHGDHQHSDVQLYGRYRNSIVPATAKPRQLQYIPSDKYHDKQYYWTTD